MGSGGSVGRNPKQGGLIRLARVVGDPEVFKAIEQASVDDLEYFVQMMELQLDETPNWLTGEQLHQSQAWTRRLRTAAVGALHNKRVNHRNRTGRLRLFRDLAFLVLGAVLAWALSLVAF